ncbi:MAG: amidohydrolase family protein [Pseudomonadota bacterium]
MKILRAVALAATLFAAIGAKAAPERPILIRGARVFDGTGAPAVVGNVLIRGDRIVAVGPRIKVPGDARVINARGLTLTPGLHDLHTHLRSPAYDAPDDLGKSWAGYLVNGVTSVNDYSVSGEMLQPIREMTGPGGIPAPHLQLAIRLGVPGGHGTEFGWGNFFTLQVATPRAAHAAMAQALPYRPDVIKVFADGWRYGRDADLNSMNEPTLSAIVEDAHKAGLPVITHTVTLEGAKVAAAAGVDSVGHGVGDALVDEELIGLMRAHHTAYIPTLVVYEPQENRTFDPGEWASFTPPERARETERMAKPLEAIPTYESKRWTIMQENIRRLKAAGIRIGIGTDAGIGGVYHGPGALREITWLSRLGFTPAEALVAATSTSANIIGQDKDHGRIAPGMRADLALYSGQPDQRIADLWTVKRVFVAGREASLPALRQLLDGAAPTPLPVHRMAGPIDTGARSDGRTDLDTLPVESTEAGVDHSDLAYVRPDEGTDKRLFLVAHMGWRPRPFAQLILPLTRGAIQLADARGFTGIAFKARGAGDYTMLFDNYGIDGDERFKASFSADQNAREIKIPFAAFKAAKGTAPLDLATLRALIVRLQGDPGGDAWLQLENLRFY